MKKSIYSLFSSVIIASAFIVASSITACSSKKSGTDVSEKAVSESTPSESTNEKTSKDKSDSENSTDSTKEASQKAKESPKSADKYETQTSEDETLSEKENTEYYRRFAKSLQSIIDTKNMNDLAELLVYPSYIGIDNGITVNNRAEFMALDENKIFTEELINAVKNADVASTELTEDGFVIGDPSGKPSVTFSLDKEGSIGITRVDY